MPPRCPRKFLTLPPYFPVCSPPFLLIDEELFLFIFLHYRRIGPDLLVFKPILRL